MENALEYAKEAQADLEAQIVSLEAGLPNPFPVCVPADRKHMWDWTSSWIGEFPGRIDLTHLNLCSFSIFSYDIAETLNNDLDQVSADLKEIMDHINQKNKPDSADPVCFQKE